MVSPKLSRKGLGRHGAAQAGSPGGGLRIPLPQTVIQPLHQGVHSGLPPKILRCIGFSALPARSWGFSDPRYVVNKPPTSQRSPLGRRLFI